MGLSAVLVPPPSVSVDTDGPVGSAIADALRLHLGPGAPGAAPGGARPAFVLVEPGTGALERLPDRIVATQGRGRRIWVVVTQADQVAVVDSLLASTTGIDALLLVDDSHVSSAGAALAAWTWLRHDAPSLALGMLRDSAGRVCRVATVAAQVPADPPSPQQPPPVANHDQAARTLAVGLARARECGGEAAEALLESAPELSQVIGTLADEVAARVRPTSQQLLEDVRDWGPTELAALLDAAESEVVSTRPAEADLAAAALAAGKAEAALAIEAARTGLGGMFGRRKRLAALGAVRDQAWHDWRATVTSQSDLLAQRVFADQVVQGLPGVMARSKREWQSAAAARAADSLRRWLANTSAAAGRLQPPLPLSASPVARSWGDAQPQVRRHLLVPAAAAHLLDGPTEDDGVGIYCAEGLQRPLALAWLLGLSASAFDL